MTVINMSKADHPPGTYVYIGRPRGSKTNHEHYGNPFTHEEHTQGHVKVGNRSEAVATFASWLRGSVYTDLRQDQRAWIIEHLHELRGEILGCWCAPAECHGDVLAKLANATCPHCGTAASVWAHWSTADMEYTCASS